MKKSRKNTASTVILILVLLVGLSLLLYPTVSDLWNSWHQTRAIAGYTEQVSSLNSGSYEQLLSEANAYNQALSGKANRFLLTEEDQEEYKKLLSVPGTSVIGYIEITKIGCYLPIYHGTDEAVLSAGVGHLEGSSLPVGGAGTHAVISGHRGLPSAKLFTNLDQLELGDTFTIYVLDEALTYEVDQIRVVEPQDLSELEIVEGEDYCTLLTCTPYGINTHRLLVRGRRMEEAEAAESLAADAVQVRPAAAVLTAAIPIVLLLIAFKLIFFRRRRKHRKRRRKRKRTGRENEEK